MKTVALFGYRVLIMIAFATVFYLTCIQQADIVKVYRGEEKYRYERYCQLILFYWGTICSRLV